MATELISIGGTALKGIVEGNTEAYTEEGFNPKTKEDILKNGTRKLKLSTTILI
jgi:hypothetical protein